MSLLRLCRGFSGKMGFVMAELVVWDFQIWLLLCFDGVDGFKDWSQRQFHTLSIEEEICYSAGHSNVT